MPTSLVARAMSIQQTATVIKSLSKAKQQQLIELVPDLHLYAYQPPARTKEEILTSLLALRVDIMAKFKKLSTLSLNQPFLDGLTLSEYVALPKSDQDRLWDEWEEINILAPIKAK